MDRMSWIRDLVRGEDQMEDTGIVDMPIAATQEQVLVNETSYFLEQLKNEFVESANAFNEMKTSQVGRVKIYGIAKTASDFMLFRNGYKMIFSLKAPGIISIRFNFISPQYVQGSSHQMMGTSGLSAAQMNSSNVAALMEEIMIEAKWGAFSELQWTYLDQPVKIANLVRYHMTYFIKESLK